MTYYILVTGGRDYRNWDRFKAVLEERIPLALQVCPVGETITLFFVFGDAHGADAMAKNYARGRHGWKEFKADWDRYDLAAGPIRNQEMANFVAPHLPYATCIAFWNGYSKKGTWDMMRKAAKKGIPVHIEYY